MEAKLLIAKAKELKKNCLNCKNCSLANENLDGYDSHVFAVGNVGAKLFFVAEAPGFDETRLKVPLIGRSGNVFNKYILGGLGLNRDDVWITNTVLCRPPKNRKPTKDEINLCSEHLLAQLNFIKPKIVIVLGAVPMSVFLGFDSGITKLSGKIYKSEKFNVDVFILPHPSWFLRNQNFDLLSEQVLSLKTILDQR